MGLRVQIPRPSSTVDAPVFLSGGGLRARGARAASVHQARSSAKRTKERSSASPALPVGRPSASSVCEMGPTASIFEQPQHPYTQALLSAVPVTDPDEPKRRIELDPALVDRDAPLREIAAGHVAAV